MPDDTKNSQHFFTIGQAAEQIGVTTKTIKNWEYSHQIPLAKRDRRNQRVYTQEDIDEIRRVKRIGQVFDPNTQPPDNSEPTA